MAARQAGALRQRPAAPALDEDVVDAGLGQEVGLDPRWQRADVPATAVEALVTEAPSLLAPIAGAEDAGPPGTETLVLRYLQEAGTVPLLTAAEEARLAEPWHTANARLLEALQTARPAVAIPPELPPEVWLAARLRQVHSWVARLDQGPAAAVRHRRAT